jgi:hypothetical protein
MTLDASAAAGERTETARALIGRAQDEPVALVTVSALELCVLGGPAHPLSDEIVTRAWTRMGHRQRAKAIESVTEGMLRRGLFIGDSLRAGYWVQGGAYALKPELGLMLAARCRPSFVLVTETQDPHLRTVRCFALGDQAEPVRGIVLELPAALPPDLAGDFPNVSRLGPLGWFYRYVLLSRDTAAEVLAKWTISPPQRSGEPLPSGYLVSVYYPDPEHPVACRLRVRGDGTRACLAGDGYQAGTEHDAEGLRTIMLSLLTGPPR